MCVFPIQRSQTERILAEFRQWLHQLPRPAQPLLHHSRKSYYPFLSEVKFFYFNHSSGTFERPCGSGEHHQVRHSGGAAAVGLSPLQPTQHHPLLQAAARTQLLHSLVPLPRAISARAAEDQRQSGRCDGRWHHPHTALPPAARLSLWSVQSCGRLCLLSGLLDHVPQADLLPHGQLLVQKAAVQSHPTQLHDHQWRPPQCAQWHLQ